MPASSPRGARARFTIGTRRGAAGTLLGVCAGLVLLPSPVEDPIPYELEHAGRPAHVMCEAQRNRVICGQAVAFRLNERPAVFNAFNCF